MTVTITWATFIAFCAGIITISGAIAVIIKAINAVREPKISQDKKINEISEMLEKHTEYLDNDNKRFQNNERRLLTLESQAERFQSFIMEDTKRSETTSGSIRILLNCISAMMLRELKGEDDNNKLQQEYNKLMAFLTDNKTN